MSIGKPTVGLEAFLALLKATPRSWSLHERTEAGVHRGAIYFDGGRSCPYIQVDNQFGVLSDNDIARTIWEAADNFPGHNPEIRKRLLEACDLKELD